MHHKVRLSAPDEDDDAGDVDWAAAAAGTGALAGAGAGVRVGDHGDGGDYNIPDDDPQVPLDWAALAHGAADTDHADGTSETFVVGGLGSLNNAVGALAHIAHR